MSKHSAQRTLQTAIAQHRVGATLEAATLYRQALAQDRKLVPALMGLAEMEIHHLGQSRRGPAQPWALQGGARGAAACAQSQSAACRSALQLALTYEALDDVAGALESLTRAVELRPALICAQLRLGALLLDCGRPAEALHRVQSALLHHSAHAGLYNLLGTVLRNLALHEQAAAAYRRALELDPDASAARSNLVYLLSYQPGLDSDAQLAEARGWNEAHGKVPGEVRAHDNDLRPERRLRVGYVSPDFRHHCQSLFMLPLLKQHAREELEVFAYSSVVVPDADTERVRCRGRLP